VFLEKKSTEPWWGGAYCTTFNYFKDFVRRPSRSSKSIEKSIVDLNFNFILGNHRLKTFFRFKVIAERMFFPNQKSTVLSYIKVGNVRKNSFMFGIKIFLTLYEFVRAASIEFSSTVPASYIMQKTSQWILLFTGDNYNLFQCK